MNASILKFAISFILCFLAAYTGSLFTPEPGSSWYYTELARPEWNPPDWLFPPVWSLLFLMMSISLWLVLKKGTQDRKVTFAVVVFCVQLLLNMSWSAAFFGMQNPQVGMIVILLLWTAIVLTIVQFRKISAVAAYLLVPYLLWVSFASYLNFTIWQLNP
ncbi:MAG: tryptophan-rich sensory protein [Chlorobi bacterium]|nr:tryptophan-rich sensory protein [Chlorobiota bacterium]